MARYYTVLLYSTLARSYSAVPCRAAQRAVQCSSEVVRGGAASTGEHWEGAILCS